MNEDSIGKQQLAAYRPRKCAISGCPRPARHKFSLAFRFDDEAKDMVLRAEVCVDHHKRMNEIRIKKDYIEGYNTGSGARS